MSGVIVGAGIQYPHYKYSLDGFGSTTVTLSADIAQNTVLEFTGTLIGNMTVKLPLWDGFFWTILNNTTGSTGGVPYTLTFQGNTGTSANVIQGEAAVIWSEGVNINPFIAGLKANGTPDLGMTYDIGGIHFDGTVNTRILDYLSQQSVVVSPTGLPTDIGIDLIPKGAGNVRAKGVLFGESHRWNVKYVTNNPSYASSFPFSIVPNVSSRYEYSVLPTDGIITGDPFSGELHLILPAASSSAGIPIIIRAIQNASFFPVTINLVSGEGTSSYPQLGLSGGTQGIILFSNGTAWYVLSTDIDSTQPSNISASTITAVSITATASLASPAATITALTSASVIGNPSFGRTNKDVSASGTITLSMGEYSKHVIELSGTLTSNTTVVFPVTDGMDWIVKNLTTGAFTLSVQGSGSAVAITASAIVYANGTDILVPFSN